VGHVNAKTCQQTIEKECPALQVSSCKLLHSGQFNDLALVNNELVFRFPRAAHTAARLARELRLMAVIGPRLTLATPQVVYTSRDLVTPGTAFAAHRLIPGAPLEPIVVARLPQGVMEALAAQMGQFLNQLHGLGLDDLRAVTLEEDLRLEDTRESWASFYRAVGKQLFAEMRPEARRSVTSLFENYLENPQLHTFSPCLRHGDLGPSNILYDPAGQRLSGIIDFDDIAVGDPAVDVAALSLYGERWMQELGKHYPIDEGMLARAQFIRATYALQEALAGYRDGDKAAYQRGMASYI
jgi:aminoglycoside 2''-phosphotransferase